MKPTKRNLKFLFHQSNLIERYDNPLFDEQHMVAWKYISEVALDQLDHHCIRKVQKIVTLYQTDLQPNQRGYYRGEVGNKITPFIRDTSDGSIERVVKDWPFVKGMMDNWILDFQELGPVKAHIRFEQIHPFLDGNGRTGRILLWWHQLHLGEPLARIVDADRDAYYQWFHDKEITDTN